MLALAATAVWLDGAWIAALASCPSRPASGASSRAAALRSFGYQNVLFGILVSVFILRPHERPTGAHGPDGILVAVCGQVALSQGPVIPVAPSNQPSA